MDELSIKRKQKEVKYDEYMIELAFQRKDHQADISLAKVIEELELDVDEIFSLVDTIEED